MSPLSIIAITIIATLIIVAIIVGKISDIVSDKRIVHQSLISKEKEQLQEKQKELDNLIAQNRKTVEQLCAEEKKRLKEEIAKQEQINRELYFQVEKNKGYLKEQENELRNAYIAKEHELLKEQRKKDKEREQILLSKVSEYEQKEKDLKNHVWKQYYGKVKETIEKYCDLDSFYKSIETGRLNNAISSELSLNDFVISAKVFSGDHHYNTTLNNCDCMDFKNRHMPCKHMLFLAYTVGALCLNKEKAVDTYREIDHQVFQLVEDKKELEAEILNQKERLKGIKAIESETVKLIKERCDRYPHIAAVIADLKTIHYVKSAQYLETKKNPAFLEAQRIKALRAETQATIKLNKVLEYRMAYIQELFPNINDIFEKDFEESEFELETEENTDRVRLFISEEEYRKLSVTERNQRALDNYIANRKSKWQVGRDYEMYIGYLYEREGYKVKYTGIIEKLEDMGRDLIATKGNDVLVVQCKNWAQEKTIHEKHIFQLYGTVVMFSLNSKKNIKGIFVTTTKLSKTAKQVAEHLGIEVIENKPLGEFPRIKCHVNKKSGEKIYHLPFDQQYDTTVIDGDGECYAFTVEEAEKIGFRRAFKHRTNNA